MGFADLSLIFLAIAPPVWADVTVSVFSGFETGDDPGAHPAPVFVDRVQRGERWRVDIKKTIAMVNYPESPIITERVVRTETGARINCPWYQRLDPGSAASSMGVRVDQPYTRKVDYRVDCLEEACKGLTGTPIPTSELLFGRYRLPKWTLTSGEDFGFADWPSQGNPICCPEFTVERIFAEQHFFDAVLWTENFRERALDDLEVDYRKIYLTFENENGQRLNCSLWDLMEGDTFRIADLRACELPPGARFAMFAQSRFFKRETLACGKFLARGVKNDEDQFVPDWFMGWYECDGYVGRNPPLRQYSFATRVDLIFSQQKLVRELAQEGSVR